MTSAGTLGGRVRVVTTKTSDPGVPAGYDPSQVPAFAVTVDVVILTMSDNRRHVLLIRRRVAPCGGMWAIAGGVRRPTETQGHPARRERGEDAGTREPPRLRP